MGSAQPQRTAQKSGERTRASRIPYRTPRSCRPEYSPCPLWDNEYPEKNSPRRRLAAGPNLGEQNRAHFLDPAPNGCSALAALLLFRPTIPPWYTSLSQLRQYH
uniref:Uncharacterized protein n=1 Tax=Ditylum brightwellii TaxID=49249 RepID=A0A7S2EJ43_9STRA|mmetsp:Transcript_21762/g.32000  ORF Transcript_21762/g.32000 Transcript_21762/m.32000 type:complete len:104 (+) Transcript_21762:1257-1568(+)